MRYLIAVIAFCVLVDTIAVVHNLAKAEGKLAHMDVILTHMDQLMERLVIAVENRNNCNGNN